MAYFKNEWNEIFVSILDEPNGKWLVSHTNPQAPLFVTSEALRFLKIIAAPSTATIIEEKQKTEAQIKRYEIIKELIEKPDYIRDKKQRKEKIKELAEYHCTTEKRISRLYYSYLANKFWKIGQGKKRISKNATRNKIFDWAIREFYYSAKRISLEDAYDHMIYAKYMGKDGKIKKDKPSFAAFKHFYYDNKYDIKNEKKISRYGLTEFQRNDRVRTGTTQYWKNQIGTYEMDATLADIYLVSRWNREIILGRPYIYLAVDALTGIIAGIYIGFECNNESVLKCLANAAMDKVDYCHQLGIEIKEEDWPSKGLPSAMVLDNGSEFISAEMEEICKKYGIDMEILPPFRPDQKPLVEKKFDIIQNRYKKLLRSKGVIEANAQERWSIDYRKQAVLDIEDFTKIIIKIVIYLNNYKASSFVPNKEMIKTDIKLTASGIWKWFQERNSGVISIEAEDIYKLSLKKKRAKLDLGGIKHLGVYYKSKEQNRLYQSIKKKKNITIAYDPDLIEKIYLVFNGEYIPFYLPIEMREYKNLNETEYQDLRSFIVEKRKKLKETEEEERLRMIEFNDNILSNAIKNTNEAQNSSGNIQINKKFIDIEEGRQDG